ncbi:hypothetical protein BDP55DRAFT_305515 [Colletotrichum godetiae]|uniref:Uncharacterized protein n=1 Tax=Colletotrichum godetiae TaxID=1209918 RepID=A0AAJ0F0J6_9PEZI|nr:uncharacterized protein BDP55DRAFT_305515 [Colletotrichum godetiae]KAK1690746.1 hypothetical protein BDP55DRAFT_305515 [Colletotrichum godetiae]
MVICRKSRSSRVLSSMRVVIFGDSYTEWTTSRPFWGPFSRWQLRLYLFLVRCLLFSVFFFPFSSYLEAPLLPLCGPSMLHGCNQQRSQAARVGHQGTRAWEFLSLGVTLPTIPAGFFLALDNQGVSAPR